MYTFAFKPHNAAISELAQRAAIQLGYKVQNTNNPLVLIGPTHMPSDYCLIFDKKIKTISWAEMHIPQCGKLASSLDELLDLLKSQPSTECHGALIYQDGSIFFQKDTKITERQFDELVLRRADFIIHHNI